MEIVTNGVKIHYEKCGEGIPVLLLHGNGENLEIFNELASSLQGRYTVYSLDTRGHGKSQKGVTVGYDLFSEDVKEFITALNIKKPLIVGFSDGGITAIKLAVKYPEILGGIIACGANLNPSGIKTKWLALFHILKYFSALVKLILKEPNICPAELENITVPSIIIAGSKDMVKESHTALIASKIKNSELFILKGETHSSYVVRKTQLSKYINDLSLKRDFVIGKESGAYCFLENINKGEPAQKTTVYAKHTKDYLEFDFICEENSPHPYGEKNNDLLYKGDVVEIFLTLGTRNRYLEVEVNPDGLLFLAEVLYNDGKTSLNMLNEQIAETIVEKNGNEIKTNIKLNKKALSKLGFKPENAFINLYRQDFDENDNLRLYALSPTLCSTFHKPEAFVKLTLVD